MALSISTKEYKKIQSNNFYVIAHNIRSLYNVGSIFRTADAFSVSKIFLTGYTGSPKLPHHANKISKVALGAENWIEWEQSKSAIRVIKKLKKQGVKIIGLENNVAENLKLFPISIKTFKPKFPLALVLGEEVSGIPKPILKLCDKLLEIPMSGKKESLNVSVAFGIAAYAISYE